MVTDGARLWVISGPSGVGKGTVCAALLRRHPEVHVSVSATTRDPRPGEVDGRTYHFVGEDEFAALVQRGDMLEHAVVHGLSRYGTPRAPVLEALEQGRHVILEIDLQGARQVKGNMPEATLVFLKPPSWDELVSRLAGRGTEDPADRERRLATAKLELASLDEADHVVENFEVEETVTRLVDLMGLSQPTDLEGQT